MKWLFVTSRFPYPLSHGTFLRAYHFACELRRSGDDVSMLSFTGNDQGVSLYQREGIEVLSPVTGAAPTRGPGRCRMSPYVYTRELGTKLAEHAPKFDTAILFGAGLLQYSSEVRKSQRVVCDFVDDPLLEQQRRMATRDVSLMDKLRNLQFVFGQKRYEKRFVESVDTITFVASPDAENFSQRCNGVEVRVVPNGVDSDYFRRPVGQGPCNKPATVIFTGVMSNPNNERAAEFLVQQIAPKIWDKYPNVQIKLVGAEPGERLQRLNSERVEVTGKVEDMRPYLWGSSVVLLPMLSGTGIKNKLLEAWSSESAVVGTRLCCIGTNPVDNENILLGETHVELAAATCRLLGDPQMRGKIARAGRELVERNFTWLSALQLMR